ncbi:MAG: septum site-determining protein MinD [Clostridia bacterium]|nr:septum site-determining protein MinD [Clostridia bacterium]
MCKVFAVASGKGGTGKTTVTAGLSSALALMGKRVCAIDADIGLSNLDLALGLQDKVVFDLFDLVCGRAEREDVLIRHPDTDGLYFIAAPSEREQIDPEALRAEIEKLSEDFDYIFIDCCAGLGSGFEMSAHAASCALVVSTPDTPCLKDSARAADCFFREGITDVRLVLNRVRPKMIKKGNAANVDESMDRIGLPLVGLIFDDERVITAFNRCEPLMLKQKKGAAADIRDIARRLEHIPVRPRI